MFSILSFFGPFPSLFQVTVTSSRQQWLDPSFQLNVPLVDVDKVYLCFQHPFFLVVTCANAG